MNPEYYTILTPKCRGTFAARLDDLAENYEAFLQRGGYDERSLLQARFYLSDAINNVSALKAHPLFKRLAHVAAVSIVEQTPLCGAKAALFLWGVAANEIEKEVGEHQMVMLADGRKYVVQNVAFTAEEAAALPGAGRGSDSEVQTEAAFERHIDLLKREGMTLEANCRRTWIFVRDIDRHYAGVVRGRNAVFAREGLTRDTHYIASTGIGGYPDNARSTVVFEFLSISEAPDEDERFLHAPDFLNPTHEYGVAFERGTALTFAGARHRFISGTASINKHGEVVYPGDVLAQADRLFENIRNLLAADGGRLDDMKYFLVYLRDVTDAPLVEAYMSERFPAVPHLVLEARVCRPGWLIEVEGVGG